MVVKCQCLTPSYHRRAILRVVWPSCTSSVLVLHSGISSQIQSEWPIDFSVNDLRHSTGFGNVTITLDETCATTIVGGCNFGSSVIENYGFIASQSNILILIGTINNYGRFELGAETYLDRSLPGVFNNLGRLTRVAEGPASGLRVVLTNKVSGVVEIRRGGSLGANIDY